MNDILLDFYSEYGPGPGNLSLDEVILCDDMWWEKSHNFIQWVFPTIERSMVNPYAPVLDPETIEEFRGIRACQENLERSLVRFMRFLRVDQTTPWWVHTSPHNYLRITRALDSLCTLSNERAVPIILYRQVMRIAEANPSKLRMSLDNYWTPAMLMKR